jgi:general secretion pathway protein C
MASRLLSFLVWALVAAGAAFWGLRLFVHPPGLPPHAQLPDVRLAVNGDLSRLLGASPEPEEDTPAPAAASERYKLLGVVAPRGAGTLGQGFAIIAVGSEPPKAWRTGAAVDGDTVLLGVGTRTAQLGPRGGPATVALELPPPTEASHAMPLPALPPQPGMPFRPGMPLRQGVPMPQPGAMPVNPQVNGQVAPAENTTVDDSDNEE